MASIDDRSSSPALAQHASSVAASAQPRDLEDNDLDPAAFLQSVRELSAKREREDNERFRKLEEDIEKGRQERLARRAEHARSVSPQKHNITSPQARAPPQLTSPRATAPSSKPSTPTSTAPMDTTSRRAEDVPESKGFGSANKSNTPSTSASHTPSTTMNSTSKPSPSAAMPSRSGTLKWQQRPQSRGSPTRPSYNVPAERSSPADRPSNEQNEPSRDQIAAALGARDPSWFKQTADRGIGNAAYRKSKDEIGPAGRLTTAERSTSERRGLLGMSREASAEPLREFSPAPESVISDAPSQISSASAYRGESSGYSRSAIPPKDAGKSENVTDTTSDRGSSRDGDLPSLTRKLTISSSQSHLAGTLDRPSSPTKGMGGFVQSAMMKRSDSVSKRWTSQPGTSLSRQNSARSGYGGLQGSYSMPRLEPSSTDGKETAPEAGSKSTRLSEEPATKNDPPTQPVQHRHARTKSVTSAYTTNEPDNAASLPPSPTKRWSPNKSSWMESALTSKPESRPASPTKNSQPTWMADLAKAKAQRQSAESTPRLGTPLQATKDFQKSPPVVSQKSFERSDSQDFSVPTSKSQAPITKTKPVSLASPGRDLATETSLEKQDSTQDLEAKQELRARSQISSAERATTAPKQNNTPQEVAQAAAPVTKPKAKPELSPKPQIDFRSNLKPRGRPEQVAQEEPEFLSRFGSLRKTATEKYVAPDLLKDNILRGKAGLSLTGGPQKRERRDELKESLLAKKDQWRKEKEEGIVHERKTSGPPVTPSKPEALAKRDVLGRSTTVKVPASPEKEKPSTPEALRRQRSVKEKQTIATTSEQANVDEPKQSAPIVIAASADTPLAQPSPQAIETSKLAARFNPGLAGILGRGPSPMANRTSSSPRVTSPEAIPQLQRARTHETPIETGQLQDMRKGRAKGPKRRKAGPASDTQDEMKVESQVNETATQNTIQQVTSPTLPSKTFPRSTASLMTASLDGSSSPRSPITNGTFTASKPTLSTKPTLSPKPSEKYSNVERHTTPTKSPLNLDKPTPGINANRTQAGAVPAFSASSGNGPSPRLVDDDKENSESGLPFFKDAASKWSKSTDSRASDRPLPIQLPNKKDEEAAMRSAGLLASSPPRVGLGVSVDKCVPSPLSKAPTWPSGPPKPAKSSRIVSGQLQESSTNPSFHDHAQNEATRALFATFGTIPRGTGPLVIDTRQLISGTSESRTRVKTISKTVYEVADDGSLMRLRQHEEYVLFEESIYIFSHAFTTRNGSRSTEVFIWHSESASEAYVAAAQNTAKTLAKTTGTTSAQMIRQGYETDSFLEAMGGILVTRKKRRQGSAKQYMLCGRKHVGHITFDEVDFGVESLCSAFVFLISYPTSLQETKTYLWKGSSCSTEEISAAKLAAMDLSETGEIIEVDDGAEFASFLKIFGPGTSKANKRPISNITRGKALAADRFAVRLFRLQHPEARTGLFANIFARRSPSPGRRDGGDKVEAREISPFTQTDLEAEGIYLVDALVQLYVLIGPLFASQTDASRRASLLTQMLLLAEDYAKVCMEVDKRPKRPEVHVVFGGVPEDFEVLFRHWHAGHGLWSTAGLMAGSRSGRDDDNVLPLRDVLETVINV